MKKVSIVNMGCKVNQYESDTIAGLLSASGFSVDFGLVPADIYCVNTCAVTNEGERKSRNVITKLLKLNPEAEIYVSGCASENNKEHFTKISNVKYVIGTQNKNRIAAAVCKDNGVKLVNSSEHISNRTRGVLKCQDGCNNFCTYCLIPYVRGREVSRPLSELERELQTMVNSGVHEVVLAGINLSAYGNDFKDGTSLVSVAKLINSINQKIAKLSEKSSKNAQNLLRYRFSSLEVGIITEDFLNYLKTDEAFCPHFHLSMQSGSNKTLKAMNRHYKKEEFLAKVELIRKYFPFAAITTDVIVGFPTETEEDFNETFDTCKKANFFEMHVFPYSSREGTVAAKLKNVATNVKDRVWKLKNMSTENHDKFIKQNITENPVQKVIVETTNGDYYTAHTANYIKCYIPKLKSQNLSNNSIVDVKLEKLYLDGALVSLSAID
ncbi:MAG: MiaB/RimO family radical SAM methylthiotransferase [Clostridia bacterium]|nr:MiaB/RimO family radical SAM methylthiotransferase [Clostridia bacterium]